MNRREKILLSALSAIAIGSGLFYVGASYVKRVQALEAKITELEFTREAYSQADDVAEILMEERAWIKKNEEGEQTYQDAQSALQRLVEKYSKDLGLETSGLRLIASEDEDIWEEEHQPVELEITIKGAEEKVYRWLVNVHQPSQYRALTSLKMSPDKNESGDQILCSVTVQKLIRTSSAAR